MSLKFIGKKEGMTQIFDVKGNIVPCTIIVTEPHVVVQVKTKEKDGYEALQLGAFKTTKAKRILKPQTGHFAKAKVDPRKFLTESRGEKIENYSVGQEIGLDSFSSGDFVDVIGISKGKGYQGVIKLHKFAGGPGAHGSGFHRHAGSTGMRTTPGRCLPGGKRASHMGVERVTIQNLEVVSVDVKKHLILLKGAIPGPRGGVVFFAKAKKKSAKNKKK